MTRSLARTLFFIFVATLAITSIARAALPILLDMVHNNPGEALYMTRYNDPAFLKSLGYTGKVFFLFESAQLAVNWSTVDPALMPEGSPERKWVDDKAQELDKKYAAAKAAGLDVFCESDLVLFPKALVEKESLQKTFGDLRDPRTDKYLRLLLDQMFARFPALDGIVVRIGETYLQDAPYHVGYIANKTDVDKTIIPLLQLLRDEVCVKLHKKAIFRTWLSFDTSIEKYDAVNAAIEPHENLILSIKHCEGDFNRGNPFSKILARGRHQYIVETECAREYEGKGAYPNYIDEGLINGFEEHAATPGIHSLADVRKDPHCIGLWTWSRGGGWGGPFITNDLWCDLNAWVIVKWMQSPDKTEEQIFDQYSTDVLHLDAAGTHTFRQLALLSAKAVIRGKRTTATAPADTISPFWTRDNKIAKPPLPKNENAWPAFLAEKDEAITDWQQIVTLAAQVHAPDPAVNAYLQTSALYGLDLYRIYRAGFNLAALPPNPEPTTLQKWLTAYDSAWQDFRVLPSTHPDCATLYKDNAFKDKPGIGAFVDTLRIKN